MGWVHGPRGQQFVTVACLSARVWSGAESLDQKTGCFNARVNTWHRQGSVTNVLIRTCMMCTVMCSPNVAYSDNTLAMILTTLPLNVYQIQFTSSLSQYVMKWQMLRQPHAQGRRIIAMFLFRWLGIVVPLVKIPRYIMITTSGLSASCF